MNSLDILTETEKNRIRITAIKAMQLKNTAGQSLIKVETDAGIYGIGEAGVSGLVARAQIRNMESLLIGKDPLDIQVLFDRMVHLMHPYRPSIPTISGIDIALWDIAGKVLNRPISKLLSGRFREEVPLYINTGTNLLDKSACKEWAQKLKESPEGWHTIKLGFEGILHHKSPKKELYPGRPSQMLTATELRLIRQGFENCRSALGDDIDFIVHCHNEWDLPSAIGLAQAVVGSDPLWIEDAMPVTYSDSWKALKHASPVRIETGEKLELAREFLPFIVNEAVDVIQPDIVFAGGFTGCQKIADLASLYYIPLTTHNVGSLVHNMATIHFGASTRNFVMTETRISQLKLIHEMGEEEIHIQNGKIKVPDKPGLGVTLIEDVLKANLETGEPYWD
ncbi:MAG: mandelate racemase/muconate lactonizing enzyme family protein [Candidatus Poribacteria bacterium]